MIRGQTRPLPVAAGAIDTPSEIKAKFNASIHNRFDIEVVDAKTGEIKQMAQAENVILDRFWGVMLSSNITPWNKNISYGSGTGTPSKTDTGLFTFVNSLSSSIVSCDTSQYGVFSIKKKATMIDSVSVGVTITEVGISGNTSNTSVYTHAMLKDMNGNQISITKTATDIINIYSTVYVHYNPKLDNGIMITKQGAGFNVDYVYSFFMWLAFGYALGQYNYGCSQDLNVVYLTSGTVYAADKNLGAMLTLTKSVDSASKKITYTAARLAYNSANETDRNKTTFIACSRDIHYPAVVIPVDTVYPNGVTISGEAIATGDGTIKDFKTYFPIIDNVSVYVDGVKSEAVTIDEGFPFTNSTYLYGVFDAYNALGEIIVGDPTTSWTNTRDTWFLKNKFNTKIGVTGFSCTHHPYDRVMHSTIYASDDFVNWTLISNPAAIPVELQRSLWFKVVKAEATYQSVVSDCTFDRAVDNNIHFATAPANGAVITATYNTHTIPKDVNHVFDFSCEIQFGEYASPAV